MRMSMTYWFMACLWIFGGTYFTSDMMGFFFSLLTAFMFFGFYMFMQAAESKYEERKREIEHAKFSIIAGDLKRIREALEKKASKRKK